MTGASTVPQRLGHISWPRNVGLDESFAYEKEQANSYEEDNKMNSGTIWLKLSTAFSLLGMLNCVYADSFPTRKPDFKLTDFYGNSVVPGNAVGQAVAVSDDGRTIIAGNPNAKDGGVAHVFFHVDDGSWERQTSFYGVNPGNRFGESVALSPDGNTAFVGSRDGKGAIRIYSRYGVVWFPTITLTLAENDTGSIGRTLAVAKVGGEFTLLTGGAGTAYVFTSAAGVWSKKAIFEPDVGDDSSTLSVALDPITGNTAILGTYHLNSGTGSAYIYVKGNTIWLPPVVITAKDGVPGDYFGYAVQVYGNTALISAPGYETDPDDTFSEGAVYAFTRVNGSWQQTAKITVADEDSGRNFGNSLALRGNTALIGTFQNYGGPYLYGYFNGIWKPLLQLTDFRNSNYEEIVALSDSTAIIGLPNDNLGQQWDKYGSVNVYDLSIDRIFGNQFEHVRLPAPSS